MTRADRRGMVFVIAAPSGTGKTSVCRRVVERDPLVTFSISHTTRRPRATDNDSGFVNYHHVDDEEFQRMVEAGAFLEWAVYNQHRYGTSWAAVEEPRRGGRDVLLEIEVQGARQVRERDIGARFIFLLPPSMKVLEKRLRGRASDAPEEMARRLETAKSEIQAVQEFDYAVVNDELERCVEAVLGILRAEREGRTRELRRRYAPQAALARLRAAEAGEGAR